MNFKQKILQTLYPLIMRFSKSQSGKGKVLINQHMVQPIHSFYHLSVMLNNGMELKFDQLKGRKVLLVNTASNCGYTGQYAELQQLYDNSTGGLTIIGFPANDFQEQEKGDDQEISQFCQVNFGVSFPLSQKSSVIGGEGQHPVY